MGESVGYIHHRIGSTVDRDRLPSDTGARVAGNRRVVTTAGERTGQGGEVEMRPPYESNRFRGVQLPTLSRIYRLDSGFP
jgi:hypothetical protein